MLKELVNTAEKSVTEAEAQYRDFWMERYAVAKQNYTPFGSKDFQAFAQDFGFRNAPFVWLDLEKDTVAFYKDKTHASPIAGAGGPISNLGKIGDLSMVVEMLEHRVCTLYGKKYKEAEAAVKALKNVRVD